MKRVAKGMVLLGIFSLVLLSFEVQHVLSSNPEITLRFAGNWPIHQHISRGQELYSRLVGEKTKGRVKVEVYAAAQLFSDKDLLRALPSGAADMGALNPGLWTGMVPDWIFPDLPAYFKSREHWQRVMDSEAGAILNQECERRSGLKVLYWINFGATSIASKVPIKVLEDFKGKRIRAHSEILLEAIKCLGAAPVLLGGGEVYMALQRGMVEGGTSGVTNYWERKYYEVTKHVIFTDMTFGMVPSVINKKKWDSLPGDVQKAMLEAAEETKLWGRKECDKVEEESIALLKGKGMEFYDPPEKEKERWREACKPVIDYYLKRGGEKAKVLLEIAEKLR